MDGSKYDGDAPLELIDSTSDVYDSTNKNHVNTAEVKKYITDLVDVKTAVVNAFGVYNASEKTAEDKAIFKAVYEMYFDIPSIIDYIIFSDVSNNYDGFRKNWQWLTYDGVKWYIGVYDCDGVFGNYFDLSNTIMAPLTRHITDDPSLEIWRIGAKWVFEPLYSIYQEDLETRYAELRQLKIIDTNSIIRLVTDWLDRIGNKSTFKKEWEKWPGFIKEDSIHRVYKWIAESINNMDIVYHYNQN
jgi:hypothetical protein